MCAITSVIEIQGPLMMKLGGISCYWDSQKPSEFKRKIVGPKFPYKWV